LRACLSSRFPCLLFGSLDFSLRDTANATLNMGRLSGSDRSNGRRGIRIGNRINVGPIGAPGLYCGLTVAHRISARAELLEWHRVVTPYEMDDVRT
jgi:hypothetical protein